MSPENEVRLFAALAVSDEFRAQAASLPRKGLDARWSAPQDLHITLRFMGEVAEGRIEDIKAALARVRRPVFGVQVSGLGSFDGKQAVLWAAVQSTRKLTALAGDINEILAPLGFEMPNKPFIPHITLARLKAAKGLDEYIRRHGSGIRADWQAHSFGLYRSAEPDSAGRRYEKLAEYPLQP